MSIKGFPTQQKLLSNSASHAQFTTLQPMDAGLRYGVDTVTRFLFRVDDQTVPRTAAANTGNPSDGSGTIIYDTATPARVGDVVRFQTGQAQYLEIPIAEVSTNYFKLAAKLSADLVPSAGDTFFIMRYATQRVDETGSQVVVASPGPSQFVLDAVDVEVKEDTGTPANSRPFPIKALDGSGVEVDFATEAKQDAQITLVGAVNETAPASDTANSGLNGRLQRIAQRLTSLIALVPASLGQKTMANSMAVTLASDQSTINVTQPGRSKVAILRNDYSSVNVTTSAYTQLTASTSGTTNRLQIFDSSGQTLVLAVGAAASEVDQIYIFPGGNGDVELAIASGSRISVKAVSANATSGELAINLLS